MKGLCTKCSNYTRISRRDGQFICTSCGDAIQDHIDLEFLSSQQRKLEVRFNERNLKAR